MRPVTTGVFCKKLHPISPAPSDTEEKIIMEDAYMEFYQTKMGHLFYEVHIHQLINAIQDLSTALTKPRQSRTKIRKAKRAEMW